MSFPRARVLGATTSPPVRRLRVEGQRFVYANGTPFRWIGCTAFDLPVRVSEGDVRFADWMRDEGFTIARIVVASVYRSPRTLSEGLAQLGPCLDALASRGLYAEVVALCDTGPEPPNYNLSDSDMLDHVSRVGTICARHDNAIVELFNERDHGTHSLWVLNNGFARALRLNVPIDIPACLGSSGGGALPLSYDGNYLTVHTDRGQPPHINAAELAALQATHDKPVICDEPQPVSEIPPSRGDRITDPAYGTRLGEASRRWNLAGCTYHMDAGLHAKIEMLGPIQREAARNFVKAMRA